MAFNAASSAELPLSVFGGLVSEMPPEQVPENCSPDNSDVMFTPGAVFSRYGLQKVFATPLGNPPFGLGSPNIVYGKSYVLPNGNIQNLYLDSFGNLYMEDETNAPGVVTLLALAIAPAGSFAKSVTAFGREYIAFSDGLHGTNFPVQWDGNNLNPVTQDGPGAPPTVAMTTIAPSTISSIARSGNLVTVTTTGAHGLLAGYQAQISAVTAQTVGTSISSVTVNNENLPGIATVTTSAAHGLTPGNLVTLTGITEVAVGSGVSSVARAGGIVTVVTSAAHGLQVGATVRLSGVTDASYNTTATVVSVPNPTTFTFNQVVDADSTSSMGAVNLAFPASQTGQPTYYQVISAPTTTTFQVQLFYSDATWSGSGTVQMAWDGTFFVKSVTSSTVFTYQQYGPNGSANAGTVTPFGQCAPGIHQCQVLFLTRNGFITRGSPTVQFISNGGQYISVSNIPIGPPNVVARILAFTGAGGALLFYIPNPPQSSPGQLVGTATQINDNTSTTATLDFSDNTLFAALGINIPGNDIPNQITIESALGFAYYASRLVVWGLRNRIQNLQNCRFDGGYLPSVSGVPSGWTNNGATVSLINNQIGTTALQFGATAGNLSQGAYQDYTGAPIVAPNTLYRLRVGLTPLTPADTGGTLTATLSSASTGFSASATAGGSLPFSGGGFRVTTFVEAVFSAQTSSSIPSDLILSISAGGFGAALQVSDMSIIYNQTPYLETVAYGSYIDNPEAFDGVSGKFGPTSDQRKIMDCGVMRQGFYMFTQDPSGRIHDTSDNGITEPAGWAMNEVAANCGVLSAFCLTKSQADDESGGGGEEWFAWASVSGARIFGGSEPWKISQEIQPDWTGGPTQQGIQYPGINKAAFTAVWAVNDYINRIIYFGLPTGTNTSPNLIYPVDYKHLDTPYAIANSPPFHPSFAGHLIATDNVRKWTHWKLACPGASLMYRPTLGLTLVLFNGILSGNVYVLNPNKLTDDDYGQLFPYYTTYFFPSPIQEQSIRDLQGVPLGSHRKLLAYLMCWASGVGQLNMQPYCDTLLNPWSIAGKRPLSQTPTFDIEWPGGNAIGQRIAIKFYSTPT